MAVRRDLKSLAEPPLAHPGGEAWHQPKGLCRKAEEMNQEVQTDQKHPIDLYNSRLWSLLLGPATVGLDSTTMYNPAVA